MLAIQKASFYSCTQLAVLAVLQILVFRLFKELAVPAVQWACCSGCPENFLFWQSRKLSFIAAQKASLLLWQCFLVWLFRNMSVLAVQTASCSGCSKIRLFWLSRKLAVSAVKKASWGVAVQRASCLRLFRKLPVLAVLQASFSDCHVRMSSSFFQKAYIPDTWRPGP